MSSGLISSATKEAQMKPPRLWRVTSITIAVILTVVFFFMSVYTSVPRGITWIIYLIVLVFVLLGPWAYKRQS